MNPLAAALAAKIKMNIGTVGTGVTIGTAAAGWASAVPVLQVLSLAVSFLVGIVTLVWWSIKIFDRLKNGK